MVDLVTGYRPHLGQIFSPSSFDLSQNYAFLTITAHILNIICVILAEALVIEKANKCLDYTLTIFILHLCFVWMYTKRFPWSFEWWMINGGLIFATTILAEWTLMRIEQQEIKLTFDTEGINTIVEQGK
jgi:protein SYS1